jgi:hypothetical protein
MHLGQRVVHNRKLGFGKINACLILIQVDSSPLCLFFFLSLLCMLKDWLTGCWRCGSCYSMSCGFVMLIIYHSVIRIVNIVVNSQRTLYVALYSKRTPHRNLALPRDKFDRYTWDEQSSLADFAAVMNCGGNKLVFCLHWYRELVNLLKPSGNFTYHQV